MKTVGKIHSLGGEEREITVIEFKDNNHVIVLYNGAKYRAVFNIFVCRYYVDDIYGRITE